MSKSKADRSWLFLTIGALLVGAAIWLGIENARAGRRQRQLEADLQSHSQDFDKKIDGIVEDYRSSN